MKSDQNYVGNILICAHVCHTCLKTNKYNHLGITLLVVVTYGRHHTCNANILVLFIVRRT